MLKKIILTAPVVLALTAQAPDAYAGGSCGKMAGEAAGRHIIRQQLPPALRQQIFRVQQPTVYIRIEVRSKTNPNETITIGAVPPSEATVAKAPTRRPTSNDDWVEPRDWD